MSGSRKQVIQQGGHRGFAVGAGNAHQLEFGGGAIVEIMGHHTQSPGAVRGFDVGDALLAWLRHFLTHNCYGPLGKGLTNKLMTIDLRTGHGHKHIAGFYLPRIKGQPRYRNIGTAGHRLQRNTIQYVVQQLH